MIAVPLAGMFAKIPLQPVSSINLSISSFGKPWGNVAKGFSETSPAISQWPVVVSLPLDFSCKVPYCPIGVAVLLIPSKSWILPNPNNSKDGTSSPLLKAHTFLNVLHSLMS